MTQTQDRTNYQTQTKNQTPARRRELPAAPVLIRIPAVAGSRPSATKGRVQVRRRRLRREVRYAGYLLLLILPVALILGEFRGSRNHSSRLADRLGGADVSAADMPRILLSISPEPVLTSTSTIHDNESPVGLSPRLLPAADASEESSDGGH